MARARTQKSPPLAPRRKAGASSADKPPPMRATVDRDRELRRVQVAARRVPVWQVSAVTVLCRLWEARPSGGDNLATFKGIRAALDQVPPEVLRAAELNMRGEWKPL